MDNFEILSTRGEGSFGTVYKAKNIKTNEVVAIKKMKKKYASWDECLNLREVNSLMKLKENENIIKLKEIILDKDVLYLIFEFMEMNLLELMNCEPEKSLKENQIRSIIKQTLQGVAYMHKYGFFHRDFKPENLLINGEEVKIADFGLAREIRSLPPYTDYVSTRWYRAPEIILRMTNYNSPVDIWAIGTLMAELYNSAPLFPGSNDKDQLIKICSVLGSQNLFNWEDGKQLLKKRDLKVPQLNEVPLENLIQNASPEAINLMSLMLQWDPNKRETAQYLLNHPYFSKYENVPKCRLVTPEIIKSNLVNDKKGRKYSSKIKDDKETDMDEYIERLKREKIESEKLLPKKSEVKIKPFIRKPNEDEINLEDDYINSRNQIKRGVFGSGACANVEKDKEISYMGSNPNNYPYDIYKESNSLFTKNNNSSFSKLYENNGYDYNNYGENISKFNEYEYDNNLNANSAGTSSNYNLASNQASSGNQTLNLKFQKIREMNIKNKQQGNNHEENMYNSSPKLLEKKKSDEYLDKYEVSSKLEFSNTKANPNGGNKDMFSTISTTNPSSNVLSTNMNPNSGLNTNANAVAANSKVEFESRRRNNKAANIEKGKMDAFQQTKHQSSKNTIVQVRQDMNEIFESRRGVDYKC